MTRRAVLRLAAFLAPALGSSLAAGHFWDSKPANQWTADEIAELVAKSPWAKQVTAQYRAAMDNLQPQPDGGPVAGRGGTRAGECGLVPCSEVMPGTVTVIWESAQPIRVALNPVIPPEFNGCYVISVRGLEGERSLDQLQTGTALSAKGKPPIQPGLVRQRNASYVFGFSKELMPLTAKDKDVRFTVHTGANLSATLLRATFDPGEMMYHGELAL